jgi:hypothetical protein
VRVRGLILRETSLQASLLLRARGHVEFTRLQVGICDGVEPGNLEANTSVSKDARNHRILTCSSFEFVLRYLVEWVPSIFVQALIIIGQPSSNISRPIVGNDWAFMLHKSFAAVAEFLRSMIAVSYSYSTFARPSLCVGSHPAVRMASTRLEAIRSAVPSFW